MSIHPNPTLHPLISLSMTDCAVGPDGSLLDADKIVWYNDADSSEPIATTNPPTTVEAVSRRSGRAIRPSNKLVDPDNVEVATWKPRHKRKASHTVAADRRINRKVTIGSSDGSDGSEESDCDLEVADHPATSEAGDTELGEDSDIGYLSTKAMGDADREVSFILHY